MTSPKKPIKKEAQATSGMLMNHQQDAYSVIKRPRISEKASLAQSQNKYIFDVSLSATKNDVRRVIEMVYKVSVQKISMTRLPLKQKTFTKRRIVRSPMKKAIVTLRSGQKIDMIAQ